MVLRHESMYVIDLQLWGRIDKCGRLFHDPASVLNRKFIEEVAMWGGPPGLRPTPPSASVLTVLAEPDQGPARTRVSAPPRFM
jgi:hypothetical protein